MNVTLVDPVMESWFPDTRHYVTADGTHLAVHVHTGLNEKSRDTVEGVLTAFGVTWDGPGGDRYEVAISDTTVIEVNEEGVAETLDVAARFAPGTTHEEALAGMGYTLVGGG